jgi:two-component system sensor histidine kinase KdpD
LVGTETVKIPNADLLWRRRRIDLTGLGVGLVAVVLVTGAVFALRPVAPVLSLGVLYVFAVLPAAVGWGFVYALVVSVLSLLVFNYFFLPPVHTLALSDPENWVALTVYLVTALVVSELAARSRRRAADAEQQRREAAFAAEVSGLLLECRFVQDRLRPIGERLVEVLGVSRAHIELGSLRRPEPGESVYDLTASDRHVGRLFLPREAAPDPEVSKRVLHTLSSLLAAAMERERLGHAALVAEGLRQSDAIKTAVLRTLSHDLRSPLTAISAASEVLDGGTESLTAAERAELVTTVRLGARRLTRLVSNLLDLSRLEAGAARPRPELWTADGLVARALEAIGPDAERVEVSLPADSPALHIDAAQIERVLVNLLENALKVSSPTARVAISTQTGAKELVLRISDDGPGIEPEELERIFEPFERGAVSSGAGTGLGLAIARGFAQANGGRLWAESSLGEGATFALALPLAPPPLRRSRAAWAAPVAEAGVAAKLPLLSEPESS